MISNDGLCPMVADHDLIPIVLGDHGRAMIAYNRWRAVIADHYAATVAVTVTSARAFLGGKKREAG